MNVLRFSLRYLLAVTLVVMLSLAAKGIQYARADNSGICMQNAVIKRTNAFIQSYNDYYGALLRALSKRRDADVASWNETSDGERTRQLRRNAQVFGEDYNEASRNLNRTKQQAWNTYYAEAGACAGAF